MKYKVICSFLLLVAATLCFTFNVFAIDMPMVSNDPEMVIDGKGSETAWIESDRVQFSDYTDVAESVCAEILCYKNTVYGFVSFTNIKEHYDDLVVRVDFKNEGRSSYVVFVISNQLVVCGDDEALAAGALSQSNKSCFMEFSFTTKYGSLVKGDLVELKFSYGNATGVEDYETMRGFAGESSYDYYVGSKLPDKVSKPQNSDGSSTKKTTKPASKVTTTASSGEIVASTKFDVENFVNEGYTDANETTVIVTLMAVVGVVLVIILAVSRKPDRDNFHKYTDDDKGCD